MFDMTPFERKGRNLFNLFDDLEKNFFGSLSGDLSQFRTDIRDNGSEYVLEAELPGFTKEDIAIDLNENSLTIRAERKEEKDEQDDAGNYIRRERKYGSFIRSFNTDGIETDGISAAYENGVLKLTMPKRPQPPQVSKQIQIQ